MSANAAGDFVKSLREKLSRSKRKIQTKRNLLQESLDFILEFFSSTSVTEIRSIRNFEINEIATYFDMYVEEDVEETVSRILTDKGIKFQRCKLADYKSVFILDLEERVISSGKSHNLISLEVCSKRLKTYKFRVSICENDFCYSVFDWGYNEIKFWFFNRGNLMVKNLNIRGADRTKPKLKIKEYFDDIDVVVHFSEHGQGESLELLPKKRKKNRVQTYNH